MLDAQNSPKKPVIAIRAASSLRHVELAVNSPFHVPLHGLQDGRVKVSLYDQLGTQVIPDADQAESFCNVPVRAADGTCSQVRLRVRRGKEPTMPNFKSSTIGVEDYLNHHQLEARIQSLFETVLKKQPQDPYRCMIEELRKVKSQGDEAECAPGDTQTPDRAGTASASASAAPAAVPKAPVAPAEPCPKSRPSPAAKGRNLKASGSPEQVGPDALAALSEQLEFKESASLNAQRQEARLKQAEKHSNLEAAHEIMRYLIRQYVAKMASSSSSLGGQRNDNRARAIEHAKMVEVSHSVIGIVMRAAYNRIQARSLGVMGGGHDAGGIVVPKSSKDPELQALTRSVVGAAIRKAPSILKAT